MQSFDSYTSAEIIAGNNDLISEILLRLPPKPLLQFRSVSKAWYSLISSPRFHHRHTHLSSNPQISGVFLRKSPADLQFLLSLPKIPPPLPSSSSISFRIRPVSRFCSPAMVCSYAQVSPKSASRGIITSTIQQLRGSPRFLRSSASLLWLFSVLI